MRTAAALGLLLVLAAGCTRNVTYRICEACLEREGTLYCGRSFTNLRLHPDVPDEATRLAAGKTGCVQFAAHKGAGYSGPLYDKTLAACQAKVTLSELKHARCSEEVRSESWNPRDGVDSY